MNWKASASTCSASILLAEITQITLRPSSWFFRLAVGEIQCVLGVFVAFLNRSNAPVTAAGIRSKPMDETNACRDDVAVNSFAQAMADKMSRSRAKGREGWQTCSVDVLWTMLREHVEKGDPVDVACLAMMIHHNQGSGT